jgi:hypothetical protein
MLRAVAQLRSHRSDFFSVLDIVDRRSLVQMLDRGAVRSVLESAPPAIADFLAAQRYLTNEALLEAVKRRLENPGS